MRRSAMIAVTLLVLAVSACMSPTDVGSPGPTASAQSSTGQDPTLPVGWRWESYGGVEVGVPGDWGWGNGSQRLGQWCVKKKEQIAKPIVGRPGVSTLAGCPPGGGTLIQNTGWVVGFDRTPKHAGVQHEGEQTAVRLDGVLVTINAPEELRQRIVATIRPVVDVDSYGCPTTHPISGKPQYRPAKPVEVTSLTNVSTVSVCRFELGEDPRGFEPRLVASLRLDGSAAEQAIQQIAKAPLVEGPNNPTRCTASYSYGDRRIVLLVQSAVGRTEIVLRYGGRCVPLGFDDGISVRSLTAQAEAPFITGPNEVLRITPDSEPSILRPSPTTR
jgi:hypothetical protein